MCRALTWLTAIGAGLIGGGIYIELMRLGSLVTIIIVSPC